MDPSLEAINEYFSPYMISPVMNLSSIVTQSYANTCESIRPFSTSPCSRLKKLYWIVVSWKSLNNLMNGATIALNSGGIPLSILGVWSLISVSLHVCLRIAFGTFWFVAPGKEIFFEPIKKSFKLFNLI